MSQLVYTQILSGSAVSGNIDLTKVGIDTILVPTIISGDLLIQGNMDTTSGNFRRLLETRIPGSGDLRFATGPGSRSIPYPTDLPSPAYARLETSVTQTAPASFTILTRTRH